MAAVIIIYRIAVVDSNVCPAAKSHSALVLRRVLSHRFLLCRDPFSFLRSFFSSFSLCCHVLFICSVYSSHALSPSQERERGNGQQQQQQQQPYCSAPSCIVIGQPSRSDCPLRRKQDDLLSRQISRELNANAKCRENMTGHGV
jgi:hypothetical protein